MSRANPWQPWISAWMVLVLEALTERMLLIDRRYRLRHPPTSSHGIGDSSSACLPER